MGGRIVVIGASLSGIDALSRLIGALPADFPAPILVAQHVAPHSPGMLPHILTAAGRLPAMHPTSPQRIEPGRVYVAPPDRHMLLAKGYIRLSHGPHENLARPAIDPLFRSAAMVYGPAVIGVVLTGQLDDGTAGLLAIKDCGGTAIVQDPVEATARSMPASALRHVKVDHCCKLDDMARILIDLANDAPSEGALEGPQSLLLAENRIAEGIFRLEDWTRIEGLSSPSGLNCPTCRSALYELGDPRVLRFRCRSGHAYSALSLLSGQSEAREMQLSVMFGLLTEEVTITKRLRDDARYTEESHLVDGLATRIVNLQKEIDQIAEWLHAMTGLVVPEPE